MHDRRRQSDSRSMVEEANRRFYDAFQRNDFKVRASHPLIKCLERISLAAFGDKLCTCLLFFLTGCNIWQAMNDIWGEGEQVQCIHPAAACIAGRQNVRETKSECHCAEQVSSYVLIRTQVMSKRLLLSYMASRYRDLTWITRVSRHIRH